MSATIKATEISFNRRVLPPIFPPPSRLVSFRGIALKLFVGVLSFYTTGKGLPEAISRYGQVVEDGFHSDTLAFMSYNGNLVSKNNSLHSSQSLMDRASVKSKGFGFVTFASEDEAHIVLTKMNGRNLIARGPPKGEN